MQSLDGLSLSEFRAAPGARYLRLHSGSFRDRGVVVREVMMVSGPV
jgi:hypothetical protein